MLRPSLLLDFANTRQLDPRIGFSRASVGTYCDRNGVLRVTGVNEPRFDFDPVTGYCKGLLIEEARTNQAQYSDQLDNAFWSKNNVTVTPNVATAPDGSLTADKIVEATGLQFHSLLSGFVVSTGAIATVSRFFKAGERSKVRMQIDTANSAGGAYVDVDLVAGTLGAVTTYGTGATAYGATIVPWGNGWYRVSLTMAHASLTTYFWQAYLIDSAGALNYNGDGVSGAYAWGSQFELGGFPTSTIPTLGAAVTRSADLATMSGSAMSSWYRRDEGTFICSSLAPVQSAVREFLVFQVNKSGSSDALTARHVTGGGSDYFDVVSKVGSAFADLPNDIKFRAGVQLRSAVAYQGGNIAIAGSGNSGIYTGATDVGVAPDVFGIGSGVTGVSAINGHIGRIEYYPKRLANSDLLGLTR